MDGTMYHLWYIGKESRLLHNIAIRVIVFFGHNRVFEPLKESRKTE